MFLQTLHNKSLVKKHKATLQGYLFEMDTGGIDLYLEA